MYMYVGPEREKLTIDWMYNVQITPNIPVFIATHAQIAYHYFDNSFILNIESL